MGSDRRPCVQVQLRVLSLACALAVEAALVAFHQHAARPLLAWSSEHI
jgi:hypothetical protein